MRRDGRTVRELAQWDDDVVPTISEVGDAREGSVDHRGAFFASADELDLNPFHNLRHRGFEPKRLIAVGEPLTEHRERYKPDVYSEFFSGGHREHTIIDLVRVCRLEVERRATPEVLYASELRLKILGSTHRRKELAVRARLWVRTTVGLGCAKTDPDVVDIINGFLRDRRTDCGTLCV